MQHNFQTFAQRVLSYGKSQPDSLACIYQAQGPETAIELSYRELRDKVLDRAALLTQQGFAGKNVALIYPTGIDFVINFIACLYVSVTAVPLNLSRNQQQFSRTLGAIKDANVQGILTTQQTEDYIRTSLFDLGFNTASLSWVNENMISDEVTAERVIPPNQLAFIQYTSGSTSKPKGVMVTQSNIIHNQESIRQACGHKLGTIAGGWLPQFHDMGLIGHMMQPLYLGGTYVFMPPMKFIQRPRRWLELISKYRLNSSASPNFGYEHCVKFIPEREDLSDINLSSWRVALNGSEPVNAETIRQFSNRFKKYGFNPTAFFPCYGMAETTLFVSGGPVGSGLKTQKVDSVAFEKGKIEPLTGDRHKEVISCGDLSPGFDIKIVNPNTHLECNPGEIGEIWLKGDSVASGYWNNEAATENIFKSKIVGFDDSHYLSTGDMGYSHEGELYITGRIKELIIVRGRNIYPYDIEWTCKNYDFSSGHAAVTSVEIDGRIFLGAVIEIKKTALRDQDRNEMELDLKGMVMDEHDVALDIVILAKPSFIPRTTSGKIQRTRCKELIISALNELYEGKQHA